MLFTTSINLSILVLIRFYIVKPIAYKKWIWRSLHVHPSYLWYSQWGLQCKTLFPRKNNACTHPIYKVLFITPQQQLHVTGNNRVRATGKAWLPSEGKNGLGLQRWLSVYSTVCLHEDRVQTPEHVKKVRLACISRSQRESWPARVATGSDSACKQSGEGWGRLLTPTSGQ